MIFSLSALPVYLKPVGFLHISFINSTSHQSFLYTASEVVSFPFWTSSDLVLMSSRSSLLTLTLDYKQRTLWLQVEDLVEIAHVH